jgi:integrase
MVSTTLWYIRLSVIAFRWGHVAQQMLPRCRSAAPTESAVPSECVSSVTGPPEAQRHNPSMQPPRLMLRQIPTQTAWRALKKKAGLAGFRCHDLRHCAITSLAGGGAADSTIMAIAGHVSRKMLERYSHVRMEAKRAAMETLAKSSKMTGYDTNHDANARPVNARTV